MGILVEELQDGLLFSEPIRVTGRFIIEYQGGEPDDNARGFVQVLHHEAMLAEQKGAEPYKNVYTVGFDDLLEAAMPSKGTRIGSIDHRRKSAMLLVDGQSVDVLSRASGGLGIAQGYRFTRVP